jgi:hypothetical protein
VATSTVTRAINGETRSPAPTILENVAARIGVGVEELSPGRPAHLTQEHSEKSSLGSTSNRRAGWTSRATRRGGQRSKGAPLDGVHRVSAGAPRTSGAAKEAA